MANKRTIIMSKCPEDFEDELKDFIDSIEDELNSIKNSMEIKGIDDLSNIETAYGILSGLTDSLY